MADSQSMVELTLKPCPTPWCRHSEPYFERAIGRLVRVACKSCGVRTDVQFSDEKAADDWNTRIDTPPSSSTEHNANRFWLVLQEPGRIPERKGPWINTRMVPVLREFMETRPTAYIHVLHVNEFGEPMVEHGPEVLQVLDGRSMSTGRKHNERVRAAHADAHASSSTPEVVEAASQALQDHMEQFHGVSLKASEWDAAARATLSKLRQSRGEKL